MSSGIDTLNISPMRRTASLPIAEVQREQVANHPEIAEIARARIAAINDPHPLPDADTVPGVPTAELIVDRAVLAGQMQSAAAVQRKPLPPIVRSVLTGIGIFATLLLLFKSPVILSQFNYLTAKPAPTTTVAPSGAPVASAIIPADPTITISKINIHAPVVYEPSVVEADVQKALESGITHYGNTPAPGQGGNAVFFGHSSNDWWEPGNFKFVFVLLDKLAPGDRFTIDYQSKRYTYEVTGSRVVLPTDLSVLNQTPEPTVTLITCTPPGTSWKRLVVTANQIDPTPVATPVKKPVATTKDNSLPSGQGGFMDQVKQGWDGVVRGFSSLFGADNSTPSGASPQSTPSQLPAIK